MVGSADAHNIQQAAGPDSAVIMWKGYDDPGDHGTLDMANAGFTARAEAGATASPRSPPAGCSWAATRA